MGAADAELKTATRALARLRPPPDFSGKRTDHGICFWLAADTLDPKERARRDTLREELSVARQEHIRAKYAASRAAKELAAMQELLDVTPEPDPSMDELCPPNEELQCEREELDMEWELLQLQREEEEEFARTCEQRRTARRAENAMLHGRIDFAARDEARRARAATREMLFTMQMRNVCGALTGSLET